MECCGASFTQPWKAFATLHKKILAYWRSAKEFNIETERSTRDGIRNVKFSVRGWKFFRYRNLLTYAWRDKKENISFALSRASFVSPNNRLHTVSPRFSKSMHEGEIILLVKLLFPKLALYIQKLSVDFFV